MVVDHMQRSGCTNIFMACAFDHDDRYLDETTRGEELGICVADKMVFFLSLFGKYA